MVHIRVSTSQLKNTAKEIDGLNNAIPVLIKELETSMTQLSTCWEGPAWGAYQKTVSEHIEVLTEIYKNMGTYSANLGKASENYYRAEQDVCAAIDRVVVL